MITALVLNRVDCTKVLRKLADAQHGGASQLYMRLMGVWGQHPDRQRVTFLATDTDLEVLQAEAIPYRKYIMNVVHSGWQAVYRDPKNSKLEVVVTSEDKPPKRRTFTAKGGKRRLVRIAAKRITNKEEDLATKTKKRKAVEEDELDELDALEELDELDEDELDAEEEEPDDEEDEEDEDDEPAPKPRSKKGKAAAKKKARSKKAAEEDDEDEDEDEDEDDEPAPKRKKGKARQSSSKAKAKSGGKKKNAPPQTRELPAGRYGPQDIADEAGCDARYVRVFLRAHPDEFPKDEESFRYAFNKRDFQRVVKAIKKQRASED